MKRKWILSSIALVVGTGFLIWIVFSFGFRPRPNVLVITMDTTRADHLSCYGYQKIKTPFIDAVAKEGVLFEEAFSVQPVTLPSHCSIFTGKYPFRHGVRDNNIYRLSKANLTLAEILKEHGYITAAFVSSYILDHQFGLNQGFQLYNDRFLKPKKRGRLPVDRRAVEVSILASKWLQINRKTLKKNSFFLWLHYYDPHADYDPPPPYREVYPGSPYDGEIAYMDDWIGYFFRELKRENLWENTVVVLVADHGESLGEYGEKTHGIFIYRATTHVPLIIRYPKKLPPGLRIKERVSTVDIVPTLLELLHLKTEAGLDGKSLLPLIKGKKPGYPRIIYSEAFIPRSFNWSELKGIREGEYFFIQAPTPELYKVKSGEREQNNLIQDYPQIAAAMEKRLLSLIKSGSKAKAEPVAVTEDMIERLKSLGYFAGGGQGAKDEKQKPTRPDPKEKIQLFNLYQRANGEVENERYDQAASLFKKIIDQDPNNPRFLLELGNTLIKQRDFEGAEKTFKHALSLDPKDPRTHYLLARCYQTGGKSDQALKEYEAAITINPDHFLAHFQTGLINIKKGNWAQAEKAFLQAKRIRPRDAATLNNLGYLTIKGKGDVKTGLQLIQEALKIAPQNPNILGSLGWAYYNGGEYDRAAAYLEAALALIPDSPLFLTQLKTVYQASGEMEKLEQLKRREQLLKELRE